MLDDLSVAVERSQSERASRAGERTLKALAAWSETQARLGGSISEADWTALDRQADIVTAQLDLLINYTAGDGFTYRQAARAWNRKDRRFTILATLLALAFSGLIAWSLARYITDPIRNASHVAGRIAGGDLDVVVPVGRSDELGDLLRWMERMRGAIKASMDGEVALRQSAQMQLANALEHSSEGVVVVDAGARIVLANAQAGDLLGSVSPSVKVGHDATSLVDRLRAPPMLPDAPAHEFECADGRWLRVSRNATGDGGSVIMCSDISIIKRQQAALNTANFWLDAAMANLSQGLCLFGADNLLKVFNQRFCQLFTLAEAGPRAGMTLDEVLAFSRHGTARLFYEDQVRACAAASQQIQQMLLLPDDRQIAMSHCPLTGGGWLATFEDVTERVETERKIAFMARHDALTGLPNRVLFAERVEQAISAARRGSRFALLCLDLDHFKQVNDTLGHPMGDDLLRAVAVRIRSCLRETDTFARLGGDEFAIIQTGLSGTEDAADLAKRITDVLKKPVQLGNHKIDVTASIGLSIAPDDGNDFDKLLKNADVALYRAKGDGRDTFRFFQRGMDEALQARRLLELDLREALARDELDLFYQPVLNIAEAGICGVEALLRWRHPTRGLVAPTEFIPLLEEIGLIASVGDFVLHRACTDAASWPESITVAVNVSAAQFRGGDLVQRITDTLAATHLPPQRLELEITESILLEDKSSTLTTLQLIRNLGVRIALDDFGTGYSSLSYLRSFPFDRLKIDQSFTRDARPESRAIIRTIIQLCVSLGMRTTAEGVETLEQLETLMREGCHEAQGFLFSPPMPAHRIGRLIASTHGGVPAIKAARAASLKLLAS